MELNTILIQVLLLSYIGPSVEYCTCETTACTNIHVCYNCYGGLGGCGETLENVDAQACLSYLSSSSNWKARYRKSEEECVLGGNADCGLWYIPDYDTFYKSCDTGCSNYTITMIEDKDVQPGQTPVSVYTSVWSSSKCYEYCLPPSQSCTVSYHSDSDTCYVYETNCGSTCPTVDDDNYDIYQITCNADATSCPTLTDPLNGVVDMSEGTFLGDQAIYTCDPGYTPSTITATCDNDGNWDTSAPTCTPVDCGSLSDPTNGTVSHPSTTFGSQATYSCDSGFTVNGSITRICGSDTNWTNTAPTCTPVDCGSLSDPTNGTVSHPSTTFGSQATYSCGSGFTVNGSITRICGSDTNWTNTAPTCTPVDCGSLLGPTNGTVSHPSTTFGSQATYSCGSGFTVNGSITRICGSDTNWTNTAPTCTPVDCGSLLDPTNGTVSHPSTTFGSQATYSCGSGFTVNGSITRICGSDTNWTNTAPTCTTVDCGSLLDPTNGTVSHPSTTFGSQATYSCDSGFTVNGSITRICGSDTNWTNTAPTCTPVDCGSLLDPTNGTVSHPSTTFGSQATYSCDSGFTVNGSITRICGSDTNWTNTAPTCTPVDCGSLLDPTNGTVSHPSTTFGSQATYSCGSGFTVNGSITRICGSDTNWTNTAPTCTPVDCGSLLDPTNGTVSHPSTTFGSQATYSCDSGFTVNGSITRICGSDTNWTNTAPTCTPVDCGSLLDPTNGTVSHPSTTFGSQATYSCDSGFTVNGSITRTCGSDTNWTNSAPTCLQVECLPLSDPTNGSVSNFSTSVGSQANYSCDNGFIMNGTSTVTCGFDLNWDNPAPICTPVDCGSLSDPTNGSVTYISTTFSFKANFSCDNGFILIGEMVLICGSDSNWNSSEPMCDPVDCGSLSAPTNGFVSQSETIYGYKAEYSCMVGYFINGSTSRECLENGNWSMEPVCEPVDCGPLTVPANGTVNISDGTTLGSKAYFSCNTGFSLTPKAPRLCQVSGKWSGKDPRCIVPEPVLVNETAQPLMYIMPCLCYPNKTFVNMTEEEIIKQLVADTRIDTKATSLAQYKLKSRMDPRVSSKTLGLIAIIILSVLGGLMVFSDLLTIGSRRRAMGLSDD